MEAPSYQQLLTGLGHQNIWGTQENWGTGHVLGYLVVLHCPGSVEHPRSLGSDEMLFEVNLSRLPRT